MALTRLSTLLSEDYNLQTLEETVTICILSTLRAVVAWRQHCSQGTFCHATPGNFILDVRIAVMVLGRSSLVYQLSVTLSKGFFNN